MGSLRAGTAAEAGLRPERLDVARGLLRRHVAAGRTPTLVAAVARHGVIAFQEAFGQQFPDGPPAAVDNIIPVASLTKAVTATLTMCLVEDGEVGVNSRVTDYLPELAAGDNDDVLVHHLLTHTHGWDDDVLLELTARRRTAGELKVMPPHGDVVRHYWLNPGWDAPRTYRAGELMCYGNYGYQLLGDIIERVSGVDIEEFARQRLFDPLGMSSTRFVLTDELRRRLAVRPPGIPYGPDQENSYSKNHFEQTCHAAAGLYSNALDMLAFGQMILDRGMRDGVRVLSPAAIDTMTSNRLDGIPAMIGGRRHAESGYGYGWVVRTYEAWRYFGGATVPIGSISHPGSGGTCIWIDPFHGLVGFCAEFVTEMSDDLEPLSWVENRFEDVIASAIVD